MRPGISAPMKMPPMITNIHFWNDKTCVPVRVYRSGLRGKNLPIPFVFCPHYFPAKTESVMLTLASFGDFCQPGCSCEIAEDMNFEIKNLQTPSKPTQLKEYP